MLVPLDVPVRLISSEEADDDGLGTVLGAGD
jgi:hypothetical protein